MPIGNRQVWKYHKPPLNTSFGVNWHSPQAVGLVAWWPVLDNFGLYTLRDRIVFADGPIAAGISWQNHNNNGPMMVMDAATEDITVAHRSQLNTPDAMTLIIWLRRDETNTSTRYICTKSDNTAGNESWYTRVFSNTIRFRVTNSSGTQTEITGGTFSSTSNPNELVCFVFRYNGTNIEIFKNGVSDATPVAHAGGIQNTTTQIRWGQRTGSNSFQYIGAIGETRLYNYALPTHLIEQVANHPAARWELYRPLRSRAAIVSASPAGQPTSLRGTTVPYLRQWQPGRFR